MLNSGFYSSPSMTDSSQFKLLSQRRFLPYFLTQFFGAFNDNVFKNALVIMIAYKTTVGNSDVLINFAFGLFILPFFLFSAFAGQIADKFEKSTLIRYIKAAECVIMGLAALGFLLNSIPLLLAVLFLMGAQSTLFGPIKYGYLPEKLDGHELVGGNGLVESSTFLAILLGTILGGFLIAMESVWPISVMVLLIAACGLASAWAIPQCLPADAGIQLNWNLWKASAKNLRFLPQNRVVFLAVLGISWFWFYGSVFLAQMPNFSKKILLGDEHVVTAMLTMFSVGIGLGSLLCEKLSGRRVEIGLVPIGALGLAIFGWDLAMAGHAWSHAEAVSFSEFIHLGAAWRVAMDLVMIGLFGGLYIVPLYSLIQERSDKSHVSRVIAGNNIINALFMVVAAVLGMVLLSYVRIPGLFMVTVGLHLLVCLYIFTVVPEFIMRMLAWLLVSLVYRVKPRGLGHIPEQGPAVLVCNHVSFIDPLIIMGRVRRPIRFVMYHKFYEMPVMHWLFKAAKAIPIAGYKENPELTEKAFAEIRQALADGDLVGIFPEGGLSPDGQIGEFKAGILRVLDESPVPVVPMLLTNLWGSFFSRFHKRLRDRRPRKMWAKVGLIAGEPLPPEVVTPEALRDAVVQLQDNGTASAD